MLKLFARQRGYLQRMRNEIQGLFLYPLPSPSLSLFFFSTLSLSLPPSLSLPFFRVSLFAHTPFLPNRFRHCPHSSSLERRYMAPSQLAPDSSGISLKPTVWPELARTVVLKRSLCQHPAYTQCLSVSCPSLLIFLKCPQTPTDSERITSCRVTSMHRNLAWPSLT